MKILERANPMKATDLMKALRQIVKVAPFRLIRKRVIEVLEKGM